MGCLRRVYLEFGHKNLVSRFKLWKTIQFGELFDEALYPHRSVFQLHTNLRAFPVETCFQSRFKQLNSSRAGKR